MDQLLTPDFWKTQWDTIQAAPWLFVPLLAVVAVCVWWLRGRIDDGEIRGLKAHRDAYKTRLDLVKDSSASDAGELAALRTDIEALKIHAGAPALASLAADAERRAITLTSSNNEIRAIVSEPISIREEPLPVISRSTSETPDG